MKVVQMFMKKLIDTNVVNCILNKVEKNINKGNGETLERSPFTTSNITSNVSQKIVDF